MLSDIHLVFKNLCFVMKNYYLLTQFDPQILISDVYDGKIKY